MPALPGGLVDISCANDACPIFEVHGKALLFIDYLNPHDREFPDTSRFSLFELDADGGCGAEVISGDDWAEILTHIRKYEATS